MAKNNWYDRTKTNVSDWWERYTNTGLGSKYNQENYQNFTKPATPAYDSQGFSPMAPKEYSGIPNPNYNKSDISGAGSWYNNTPYQHDYNLDLSGQQSQNSMGVPDIGDGSVAGNPGAGNWWDGWKSKDQGWMDVGAKGIEAAGGLMGMYTSWKGMEAAEQAAKNSTATTNANLNNEAALSGAAVGNQRYANLRNSGVSKADAEAQSKAYVAGLGLKTDINGSTLNWSR